MSHRYKKWYLMALVGMINLGLVQTLSAAAILFEPPTATVRVGERVTVDVLLDPGGDNLNAVEGAVHFPAELLTLAGIEDGDSIISLWVKRPTVSDQSAVVFSGIIPGGFSGVLSPNYRGARPGKLFRLILSARVAGAASIGASGLRAFLNDGRGTPVSLTAKSVTIVIQDSSAGISTTTGSLSPAESTPVTTPPDPFTPFIVHTPMLYDGKYTLVWLANPNGSGIDHYEVKEWRWWGLLPDTWRRAESPHLLADQSLSSPVSVKAVDRSGNERVASLPVPLAYLWYLKILAGIIIVGALFMVAWTIRK